jgi:hypothetical protein
MMNIGTYDPTLLLLVMAAPAGGDRVPSPSERETLARCSSSQVNGELHDAVLLIVSS